MICIKSRWSGGVAMKRLCYREAPPKLYFQSYLWLSTPEILWHHFPPNPTFNFSQKLSTPCPRNPFRVPPVYAGPLPSVLYTYGLTGWVMPLQFCEISFISPDFFIFFNFKKGTHYSYICNHSGVLYMSVVFVELIRACNVLFGQIADRAKSIALARDTCIDTHPHRVCTYIV